MFDSFLEQYTHMYLLFLTMQQAASCLIIGIDGHKLIIHHAQHNTNHALSWLEPPLFFSNSRVLFQFVRPCNMQMTHGHK